MKCDVIKDLLPSYMDGLTSETSNAIIEEHLKECEECRKYLEAMQKEMVSERYVKRSKEEVKEDIKPFQKLKRETRIKVITAFFTALFVVAVLGTICETFYGHGVQASVEDVEIIYEKTDQVVSVSFWSKDDSKYIELLGGDSYLDETKNKVDEWNKIQPVIYRMAPFENPHLKSNRWGFLFMDEKTIIDQNGKTHHLTGGEKLEIEFAGETKEVKIIDLFSEDGIEQLK